MASEERCRRVGEQIQRELAEHIRRDLNDPRLEWVTISAVRVSRDLSHATVYVTVINKQSDIEEELSILNKVSGFLRKEIGKRMRLRTIPRLHFVYDESIERGARLTRLIEDAVASDHH
jgi:ribosome-binding factor A